MKNYVNYIILYFSFVIILRSNDCLGSKGGVGKGNLGCVLPFSSPNVLDQSKIYIQSGEQLTDSFPNKGESDD